MLTSARVPFALLAATATALFLAKGVPTTAPLPGRILTANQAAQVFGGQTGGGCHYYISGAASYCAGQTYSGCGSGACAVTTGFTTAIPGGSGALVAADCSQMVCNGNKYICGGGASWVKGCSG